MFVFDEYSQRFFAFRFRNGSFNCGAAKVERISGGIFLIGPEDGVGWGQFQCDSTRVSSTRWPRGTCRVWWRDRSDELVDTVGIGYTLNKTNDCRVAILSTAL